MAICLQEQDNRTKMPTQYYSGSTSLYVMEMKHWKQNVLQEVASWAIGAISIMPVQTRMERQKTELTIKEENQRHKPI